MKLRAGLALAVLASLSGVVLLWLSGGFIMAAGLAGIAAAGLGAFAFNLMIPSALVRLLALTRVVASYAERLALHDAMLEQIHALRLALLKRWSVDPNEGLAQQGWRLQRLMGSLDRSGLRILTVQAPIWAGFGLLSAMVITALIQPTLFWVFAWIGLGAALAARIAKRVQGLEHQLLILDEHVTEQQVGLLQGSRELIVYQRHQAALEHLEDHNLIALEQRIARTRFGLGLLVDLTLVGAFFIGLLLLDDWIWRAACALGLLTMHDPLERWVLSFAQQDEILIPSATPTVDFIARHVAVQNLSVGIDHALNSNPIDFSLEHTPRLVLTGPSGVGKTLLLEVLVGLRNPLSGHRHRPEKLGYLPQHPHIFQGTVRENLALYDPKRSDAELLTALGVLGLDERLSTLDQTIDADQLSGGEIRRIGLARLMLSGASTWVLDEPLAGLDDLNIERVLQVIDQVPQWIIVSHDDSVMKLPNATTYPFPY